MKIVVCFLIVIGLHIPTQSLSCYVCDDGCDNPVGYLRDCLLRGNPFCFRYVVNQSQIEASDDETPDKRQKWPRRGCGYQFKWYNATSSHPFASIAPVNFDIHNDKRLENCPVQPQFFYTECYSCNDINGCNRDKASDALSLCTMSLQLLLGSNLLLISI